MPIIRMVYGQMGQTCLRWIRVTFEFLLGILVCFGDVSVCLCGAGVLCAAALVHAFSILRHSLRILSLETTLCPPSTSSPHPTFLARTRACHFLYPSQYPNFLLPDIVHHSYPRTRSPSPIFNLHALHNQSPLPSSCIVTHLATFGLVTN